MGSTHLDPAWVCSPADTMSVRAHRALCHAAAAAPPIHFCCCPALFCPLPRVAPAPLRLLQPNEGPPSAPRSISTSPCRWVLVLSDQLIDFTPVQVVELLLHLKLQPPAKVVTPPWVAPAPPDLAAETLLPWGLPLLLIPPRAAAINPATPDARAQGSGYPAPC